MPFEKGSGRLELAQAIASENSPLTARVIVNRVWMYHFGAPLVRTPSDFGLRSEPPSHPELLDYLAARFIQDGWSLKKLHRLIMVSRAYQQSSEQNAKAAKEDPGNQLLWRMNRKRLDFEAMRDTFLALGGGVDVTQGGRPVDLTTEPFTARRTIYGFVERQNLPGLFRTFDFASPDTSSSQRFATTVPQQALFLMNSPFLAKQARSLVDRPEVKLCANETDKISTLYEMVFQRKPEKDELRASREFLRTEVTNKLMRPASVPAWLYGYGEFDTNRARVKTFEKLPQFVGASWQGGPYMPDAKLGWVQLTAEGGHPGVDP